MRKATLFISLLLITIACAVKGQSKDKKLDDYFKAKLSNNSEQPVATILVYLENEENDLVYHKGFGQLSVVDKTPVLAKSPFKIASVTKMFTSTLILQLVEEKRISLNDQVSALIGDIQFVGFDRLMLFEDKNYSHEITVKHLLSHTSGLADIFTDTEEEFMGELLSNPERQWAVKDLFSFYYKHGLHERAHFKPGKGYYYSDINYFLLGLIIEKYRGISLAKAYRKFILKPAEMKHTYFEYHEVATNPLPFPSSYIGNIELNKNTNTSFDWAGGGLVSTTYDLHLFMKALFDKKLFKSDKLHREMITDARNRYGYGIFLYEINGERFYGHGGYWGSDVFYSPSKKITMIVSVNQTNVPFKHNEFIKEIYDLIQ